MNNPDPYHRPDRSLAADHAAPPAPAAQAAQPVEPNRLAIHGDPSVRPWTPTSQPGPGSRSVAWLRPSELPILVGTAVVRRMLDAHPDPARRLRPAVARISRSRITRPAPVTPSLRPTVRDEGLSM